MRQVIQFLPPLSRGTGGKEGQGGGFPGLPQPNSTDRGRQQRGRVSHGPDGWEAPDPGAGGSGSW